MHHYEVLGVAVDATAADLRRAYLARARQHHPDTGGRPGAMTEVNEAWAVLSDPARRRQYDLELGLRRVAEEPRPEPVRLPFDADAADLLDDEPVSGGGAPAGLPLVPPALFVLSVAVGCVALVLDAPAVLGAAAVLFALSCVAVAAVALFTLRGTAARR